MDQTGFRAYLESRRADEKTIERTFSVAEKFEAFARDQFRTRIEDASADVTRSFVQDLVTRGENTYDSLLALARFSRFLRNVKAYVALLEIIDGYEAFDNLYRMVGDESGASVRDEVFAGIEAPALGVSNTERARRMRVAVERLEARLGRDRSARLIGRGLRDLPDEGFFGEKQRFEECGGIDAYLRRKGDEFIAELGRIQAEDGLYFSQPITDEVIAFVESHPEIRQGVRVGRVLYEAKIPYMAVEYLREPDPERKAYYYCHCPWARESLQRGEKRVSPTFCYCSAAFHRKPYEVIFGQRLESEVLETVLAGGSWCRFAIHLPEGVV
jgi:hypothetical protein